MNSEVLLEKTNLTLFVINEYTLTKWYKNRVRREEVTSLLQGITLPSCATSSVTTPDLPPAKEPPSSPPPPPETPHVFVEPEDTSGQARVRNSNLGTFYHTTNIEHTYSTSMYIYVHVTVGESSSSSTIASQTSGRENRFTCDILPKHYSLK